VNGDDALLMEKSGDLQRITYGAAEGLNTRGHAVESEEPCMELVFDDHLREHGHFHISSRLIGNYNAPNALAAVCVGHHFGVPDEVIAGAISDYTPSNNRSQLKDTGRNQLVLDAYNANPTSMAAALENFAKLPGDKPKLAILGDMLELGKVSRAEHAAMASLVDRLGLEALFVGQEFMQALGDARCHPDAQAATKALQAIQPQGRLILVKGSRGIKLETLVEQL
jgi:UDP-N-acetylmuramoyl-tripeptide--D-alanyl-D-alanine ligase